MAADQVLSFVRKVEAEMFRQIDLWGEQNHPSFDPHRIHGFFGNADQMRTICETAFAQGRGTWADILLEEVAEAFDERDDPDALVKELIQVAAVALSWAASVERNGA